MFAAVALVAMVLVLVTTPTSQPEQQSAATTQALISPFDTITIEGKAAVVRDVLSGEVLYAKNANAQLPLASVTKTMLALVAAEQLSTDTPITITPESLAPEGDSGFVAGEIWRMRDLLDFTLLTSSNDGATALGIAIEQETGIEIGKFMTNRANELGLEQTYFLNPTGLDENEEFLSGSYGSAHDIAILFSYIALQHPDLLEITTTPEKQFTNTQGTIFSAVNTNSVTGDIPGLSASKTGFTDLAGGNLAIAFEPEPGHPLVAVVLGSSLEGRFSDITQLVRAALQ